MAKWQYDPKKKTYIDEAGRAMSQRNLDDVRDQYLASMETLIDSYVDNLNSGAWTVAKFEEEMRKRLKNAYIAEYTLGAGGFEQMTQADYGRVGAQLKKQYKYLRTYLEDVAAGKETTGNASQRAKNFLGSARQAFGRGKARAWDITLPAYPADGSQNCHGNCRCAWDIEAVDGEVHAYWIRANGDSCDTCVDNANKWNPYVITLDDSA